MRPNLLIVGSQKGGSTWLYDCLSLHKQVFLPKRVELLFFNKKSSKNKAAESDYLNNFIGSTDYSIVGEKTPSYLWAVDENCKFCKPPVDHNPNLFRDAVDFCGDDLKIIYSLRHPVWRAVSGFFHHAKRDRINPGDSIKKWYDKFGIVDLGFYSRHIAAWKSVLKEGHDLPLVMERDIVSDPSKGLAKVFDFLNLYEDFSILRGSPSNAGDSKIIYKDRVATRKENSPYVSADDLCELLDIYKNDMDSVRDMLSDDLPEWRRIDREIDQFRQRSKGRSIISLSKSCVPEDVEDSGILCTGKALKSMGPGTQVIPPCKIGNANLVRNVKVGAFSYLIDGFIYSTEIGNYCSIARDVNIGQGNHPLSWVSTHPFQYGDDVFGAVNQDCYPTKQSASALSANRPQVLSENRKKRTLINHDVWVGHGAIINAGVNVGVGAVVGAGSVVTKDVPPYAIVGGVPAKIIRYRFSEEQIARLLKSEWWIYAPWQIDELDFSNVDVFLDQLDKLKTASMILPFTPLG